MDLKQLQYFLSIAEHRGFAAAARARYISQSALSRQMQLLEDDLGIKLFARTSRGVQLTSAGEILRERATIVFENVAQLKEDVLAEAQTPAGRVVLGLTPSMRVLFAGSLIERFLKRFPRVSINVIEGLSHSMADAVLQGLCDVSVFVMEDAVGKALHTRLLVKEPMVFVGAGNAALRMDTPVDVGFVASRPLLVSRSNRVNSGIERKAAKLGLSLNVLMDVQALHLVIDLVCRGVAYTMVPYSAISRELEAGHVCAAPIVGIQTGWVVAWPRDRKVSIATLRLIDAVQAEFEQAYAAIALRLEMREDVARRSVRARSANRSRGAIR